MTLVIWFEIMIPVFAALIFAFMKPRVIWKARNRWAVKGGEPTEEALGLIRIFSVIALILVVVVNFVEIPRIKVDQDHNSIAQNMMISEVEGDAVSFPSMIDVRDDEDMAHIAALDEALQNLDYSGDNVCEHDMDYKISFSNGNEYYLKTECGGVCMKERGQFRQAEMTDEVSELLQELWNKQVIFETD